MALFGYLGRNHCCHVFTLATALIASPMAVALLPLCALGLALPNGLPASMGDALLQVRLSNLDRPAMALWLRRRSFASVLPIQPMLIQPLTPPLSGIELSFRRKPSSEKGGMDGGMRFSIMDGEGEEEEEKAGVLLVTRISEGQYTSKIFSERKLLRRLVDDLEKLPEDCGVVCSVVDLTAQ